MKRVSFALGALAAVSVPLAAAAPAPEPAITPGAVVDAAPVRDWIAIAPTDLIVMDLTPAANGKSRRVVIQFIPAPFSRPWVENIRALARAHWWDGLAIVRVQDNYVVQWGDPGGEDAAKAKALPAGLQIARETDYGVAVRAAPPGSEGHDTDPPITIPSERDWGSDPYVRQAGAPEQAAQTGTTGFSHGFPVAMLPLDPRGSGGLAGATASRRAVGEAWPIHCYGSIGVGRDLSPDAGSGAELYTVIGQAPRQLDRNIAVVGRVIEGIEHLSSLPRGTGELGFYETPQEYVPIAAIRLGTEVPDLPAYQYLSTASESFARYVHVRANRKDDFYIRPAGGVDICNVPVPVRRVR